ncbi:MAG TPA: AI-2E family transporter [Candidatus Binatia bacterium]|jgi:predicted PurR-regulated permease PerM|nr:AI-2E family transporter [Candidatus Binatia bacterium]
MNFPPPTDRQARLFWLSLSGLSMAVLAGLVAGLIWGLGRVLEILSPVLWPIAVAGVIAYLLDPVVDLLERKGLKRPPAILMVFGIALVTVGALLGSIVPQLVSETRQLAAGIPAYASRAEKQIENWVNHPPPLIQQIQRLLERGASNAQPTAPATATNSNPPAVSTDLTNSAAGATNNPAPPAGSLRNETLETAADWAAKALPQAGRWLFGQVGRVASWFGVLAGLALIPVYTFYFLLEKRGISSRWTDYLPVADSHFKNELVFVLNSINNYLITFFRGQVLVAMCDGVLYGVGFLIIGLPYALLIGVAAVFLTIIPFLGAIVVCLTALLIAVVQFGDWRHPLLVLVVFACVQALEGLVISPKIMGGRVGLHPVTIIIAVMVGTTLLGGLLGGILAIPLTAALRVVMFRYVWKRDAKRET